MQLDYIQKQENKGRIMLQSIVVANLLLFAAVLVLSMINGIFNNMLGLIIQMILCVFIYFGGNIAKWIYIVINSLNVLQIIVALMFGQIVSRAPTYLTIITIIMLMVSIASILLLILSSSVKDYMYKQRND